MSLSAGARIGPYEVIALLGAGGMGEVYRGRDARLGRDVALKVLPANFSADAERMARFQREAQVLASLNHPHIAALYGLEDAGGVRALVMELVEGPTLEQRIRTGAIPIEEALAIAKQIAEALEAAHDRGITHRDLKPANVKLTPDGLVKVLDFGLAKALDNTPAPGSDPANSPTITMGATLAGAILGTAAYMSPEQARGKPVDRRADIWAFGVVLMEMLTGKPLYSGETVADTLAVVITKDPAFDALPAATPLSIRRLIGRCLEKDPRRRLQAIGEARIAIEGTAAEGPPEPLAKLMAATPRRAVVPWIVAGVALVCSLIFAFLHFRPTPPTDRVYRYSIPPPEKTTVSSFALSPDGRYLAIAAGSRNKRQLWLRRLDELTPQVLPGTDDAQYPFWSPDSGSIGFFAEGKLKKIAVGGGPAQTLCDAPFGRGGDWNREGIILFGNSLGPMQRVAAAGGAPSRVTRQEGASQSFPVFLPDGRRFFYLATRVPSGKGGVYAAALDSPAGRRVLADVSSVAWLPPQFGGKSGHLIFVRESTLMAQPLGPETLRPTGDLFPVAEQVSVGLSFNAGFSISGTRVLTYWYLNFLGAGQNQLAWYDRSGKALGNVAAPGRSLDFTLAPDERTIAMSRGGGSGQNTDIWIHELARAAETRFTFQASTNFQPIWSPDGHRIVFSSYRAGQYDLYLKDTNGTGKEELLLGPGPSGTNKHPTDWSPDGKFLLYTDYGGAGGAAADLWVLPAPGTGSPDQKPAPFLQTEFNETQGQFSPDGHWIAYASDESGRYEIYVRPFPAGAGKWRISIEGGQLPRWRRDGKELFYLSPEPKLMAVAVRPLPGAQPVFEAAAPRELFDAHHIKPFNSGLNTFVYAVAADGKRFLVNTTLGDTADTPMTVVVNWFAGVKK